MGRISAGVLFTLLLIFSVFVVVSPRSKIPILLLTYLNIFFCYQGQILISPTSIQMNLNILEAAKWIKALLTREMKLVEREKAQYLTMSLYSFVRPEVIYACF